MPEKKRKRRRIIRWVLLGLLVLLIVFRLMLPRIVLNYVNKQLTKIDGYTGHVDDIDIALIRGAYVIKDIRLDKTGGQIPVPFFSADRIDISVEWKALFHGGIVGEIVADSVQLNYVKGPTPATSQTKVDKDWIQVVDNLIPLKINRFEVKNSEIHYRDFHASPKVDVALKNLHIVAENLSNIRDKNQLLPSTVYASAGSYGGTVEMNMKLDGLNHVPTFDMNCKMQNFDLTQFNDFIKAYGKFDVSKGTLSIYTEAAAKDGKIKGYAKPLIKDLKVVSTADEKDSPVNQLWEQIVGAITWIFKNHQKDQLATQIDFEGSVKNPNTDIWDIISEVLRNAFIQALYPSLENSVNINSVGKDTGEKKGFLGIGKKKKDKKNK